jgi:hypothetical protein
MGEPFTWRVLESCAPGWSKKIQEMSMRYGYNATDDLIAAGSPSEGIKDIEDAAFHPA